MQILIKHLVCILAEAIAISATMRKEYRYYLFQVDALRMCANIESIKKGNLLMEAVMKRKKLSLVIEKCSIIAFGT